MAFTTGLRKRTRREPRRTVDRAAHALGRRDEALHPVDLDRGVDHGVARGFEERNGFVVERVGGVAQVA